MTQLVHITTVPQSLMFVAKQMAYMKQQGFDIEAISSPGAALSDFGATHQIRTHGVAMERKMTPLSDARTLAKLTWHLKRTHPQIVHAHTPKGGLLGMTAASLAQVPVRIYHMRGLLTLTATGRQRAILSAAETTSCELAHVVICQSRSLRRHAVDEGLVDPAKAVVLVNGSNGVDAAYFDPDRWRQEGARLRAKLGIPANAPVVGFVGRLVGDKGIRELVRAWSNLKARYHNAHLLMVGPYEDRDPVDSATRAALEEGARTHLVGFVKETAPYYAAMDILTLPSYREGFPNAPLEAAAMGLPVVTTHVVGCRDAVENRKTGVLVKVKDPRELEFALARYIAFPALRASHGRAGRKRIIQDFDPEAINEALADLYHGELGRWSA